MNNQNENLELKKLSYNEESIPCPINEGHRMIPVKTVCTIIDVKFENQDSWLKKHEYFGQLYLLVVQFISF